MVKSFLCIGEDYEKDGEQKVFWHRIGEMWTGKNGKPYAKIYTIPGKLIHVFEDEKKKETKVEDF